MQISMCLYPCLSPYYRDEVSQIIFFLFHYYLPLVVVKSPSRVPLFATPWAVAYQAPPSMGFSRQEAGVGCHFLLQGIFPTQGSNSGLPHCRQMLLPSEPLGKPHNLPLNLFYFFIGVQLLYNIVFLQCNSVNQLYVYVHSLPLEPLSHQPPTFPSRSPQSSELSSLCCRTASHELSV